jgi:transposase
MLDLENDLRGTLKNFGFKVGKVGAASFEARVRELVDGYPTLRAMVIPVLVARAALREQFKVLHALLLRLVRHDRACRLLMTAPGVGPVAAMTFRATVDVPARGLEGPFPEGRPPMCLARRHDGATART